MLPFRGFEIFKTTEAATPVWGFHKMAQFGSWTTFVWRSIAPNHSPNVQTKIQSDIMDGTYQDSGWVGPGPATLVKPDGWGIGD